MWLAHNILLLESDHRVAANPSKMSPLPCLGAYNCMFRLSVSHYPTCLQMPSACHGLVMAAGCVTKHRRHAHWHSKETLHESPKYTSRAHKQTPVQLESTGSAQTGG